MSILIVIIVGAVIGLLASKVKGSGFGMTWDMYLGITGAMFVSSVMVFAYYTNFSPKQNVIGANFYSIIVDIAGAAFFILAAAFFHKLFFEKTKALPNLPKNTSNFTHYKILNNSAVSTSLTPDLKTAAGV